MLFIHKKTLEKFGILLFPFFLPLPLPLIVKSITLALFFSILIFKGLKHNFILKKIISDKVIILFAILYLLDPILAILRGDSIYFSSVRISFLIAPVLFFCNKEVLKIYRNEILKVFVIGVYLYILFTILYLIYFFNISPHTLEFNYFLKYVTYYFLPNSIHHTYMGMYISFAAAIIILNNKLEIKLKAILLLILFISVFIIASKFSIVFFTLTLSFCFAINITKSLYKVLPYSILFSSIGFLAIFYMYLKTDLFTNLKISFSLRESIFKCSFETIQENILMGVGNKNIKEIIQKCDETLINLDTHNIFLQEFVSNGIFGFIILTILLFIFFIFFIKKKIVLGVILVIMVMAFGFIEHVLNLQNGVLFITFFLFLFYYTSNNKNEFVDTIEKK